MADLYHWLDEDLDLSPTNDLRPVDGPDRGRQRVIRRCLTVPGTYLHHPSYGVGLQRFIGQPVEDAFLMAKIRSQIFQEAAVRQIPQPINTLSQILNGIAVNITYVDNDSGQDVVAEFSVGG